MNDSENPDSAPDSAPLDQKNLETRQEALQKLFQATLVALLIMGVSLNILLYRQKSFVSHDLKMVRPQVSQILANYQKKEEPESKRFIDALVNYGRAHPDFNPILTKYKIPLQTQSTGTAPAVSPTPAPKK